MRGTRRTVFGASARFFRAPGQSPFWAAATASDLIAAWPMTTTPATDADHFQTPRSSLEQRCIRCPDISSRAAFLRKTPHPAHGLPCGVFQKCRRNDREKSRLNSRVVDSKDDLHGPRGSLPAARAGVVPAPVGSL